MTKSKSRLDNRPRNCNPEMMYKNCFNYSVIKRPDTPFFEDHDFCWTMMEFVVRWRNSLGNLLGFNYNPSW